MEPKIIRINCDEKWRKELIKLLDSAKKEIIIIVGG